MTLWVVGFNESGKPPTKHPKAFATFGEALRGLIEELGRGADYAAAAGEPDDVTELEGMIALLTAFSPDKPREFVFTLGSIRYWLVRTN